MAGLQHTREGVNGGPARESRRSPSAAGSLSGQSQPLGVILFCRRKRRARQQDAAGTDAFAEEAVKAIAELERQMRSRVYRVYACEDGPEDRWEYFSVLEFSDLQAWNLFEQDLERNGFGARFDYNVRAFGRRIGQSATWP